MAKILIVEDERDLADLIAEQLTLDGHRTRTVHNGETGLKAWKEEQPDLVILDWMLPGMDGVHLCKEIRKQSVVPILMLTAKGEEMERVWGLEMGADDYMTKPFSMRELQARVRASLRRVVLMERKIQNSPPSVVDHGFIRLLADQREVHLEGAVLELTPKEYELLSLLLSHPRRVFSRTYLLEEIWGGYHVHNDRSVDSHVSRLRRKLVPYSASIETVWGTGYRFVPDRAGQT
ncbi:response regulator transcription factor [Desmospora profundinema]|uniref:DNA-binding response OmpR family regulator n=1 Tax=Desmospora profundinema TaxID=1571184 RepID=A0ABU1IR41_9BACL|nr:response regulator transcription factor [Desmospora profundinema]MDR6227017.1 DNA-binding response OmpR family regulator [Desmospora profundinema]